MREIRFRVLNISDVTGIKMYYDVPSNFSLGNGGCIMQYTGLKDKNGKEIYEGDIIHFQDWDTDPSDDGDEIDEGIGQVLFGHTTSGFGYTHGWYVEIIENKKYKPHGYFRGLEMQVIEVIGNIYENKELLND